MDKLVADNRHHYPFLLCERCFADNQRTSIGDATTQMWIADDAHVQQYVCRYCGYRWRVISGIYRGENDIRKDVVGRAYLKNEWQASTFYTNPNRWNENPYLRPAHTRQSKATRENWGASHAKESEHMKLLARYRDRCLQALANNMELTALQLSRQAKVPIEFAEQMCGERDDQLAAMIDES